MYLHVWITVYFDKRCQPIRYMVFYGVTGLKSQELGYLLFHYLNLENTHILYWVLNEDFQANYHGRGLKFGNKNVLET
jgi:hypothetical protein